MFNYFYEERVPEFKKWRCRPWKTVRVYILYIHCMLQMIFKRLNISSDMIRVLDLEYRRGTGGAPQLKVNAKQ